MIAYRKTGLRNLWLILLLFPMPAAWSDFWLQRAFLVVLLVWLGTICIRTGLKQVPFTVRAYAVVPGLWAGTCVAVNFLHINDYLDVLTEIVRYSFLPILFFGVYLEVIKGAEERQPEDMAAELVKIYILIELYFCLFYMLIPSSREILSLGFNTNKTFISDYLPDLRMSGTLENPNYFGFASLFVLMLYRFVVAPSAALKSNIVFISSLLMMIFLTGSRTALLTTTFFMFATNRYAILCVALFSPLLVDLILSSRYAVLLSGNLLSDESAAIRFSLVKDALGYIVDNPFFGLAENPLVIIDNGIATVMVRYGISMIGVVCISKLLLYAGILRRCLTWKALYILGVFNIGLVIFLLTGEFLDNFRLFITYSICELILLFHLAGGREKQNAPTN